MISKAKKIQFLKPEFEYTDDRGSLKQLTNHGWNQVNIITSKKSITRGNHFHKNNKEAFYIIEGAFELILDRHGEKSETYTIKRGDFFVIDTEVNHTFKYTEDTVLIAMYDKGVEEGNGKMDIYSWEDKK